MDLARQDVRDFDYPDEAYDLALAVNVYQFLPPEEVPSHMQRLARRDQARRHLCRGRLQPGHVRVGRGDRRLLHGDGGRTAGVLPRRAGWLLLDRTEYWIYRPAEERWGRSPTSLPESR